MFLQLQNNKMKQSTDYRYVITTGSITRRYLGGDMENGHDSRAIANQIIRIGNEKGVSLTIMKLIKLVFFAHGWNLGLTGNPLSRDPVEAWQYGPVFRTLYNSLPYSGSSKINGLIIKDSEGKPYGSDFSKTDRHTLEKVIEVYGSMGAFALSDKTHQPNTPWDTTIKTKGHYSVIENNLIQKYFQEAAERNVRYATRQKMGH